MELLIQPDIPAILPRVAKESLKKIPIWGLIALIALVAFALIALYRFVCRDQSRVTARNFANNVKNAVPSQEQEEEDSMRIFEVDESVEDLYMGECDFQNLYRHDSDFKRTCDGSEDFAKLLNKNKAFRDAIVANKKLRDAFIDEEDKGGFKGAESDKARFELYLKFMQVHAMDASAGA